MPIREPAAPRLLSGARRVRQDACQANLTSTNPFGRPTYGQLEPVSEHCYIFRNTVNSGVIVGDNVEIDAKYHVYLSRQAADIVTDQRGALRRADRARDIDALVPEGVLGAAHLARRGHVRAPAVRTLERATAEELPGGVGQQADVLVIVRVKDDPAGE